MPAEQTYRYTWQDIERYLNGSLNAQEMHDLERAALNDPLLADAIDGYEKADAAVSAKHLNEIAALLHKTEATVLPMPAKKNNWWRWAAAAGVIGILVISAYWLMAPFKTNITEIAQNRPVENNTLKTEKSNTHSEIASADKIPTPSIAQPSTKISESIRHLPATVNKRSAATAQTKVENDMPNAGEKITAPANEAVSKNETIAANSVENDKELMKARVVTRAKTAEIPVMNTNIVQGKITDDNGMPIAGASIMAENAGTISNPDGRFSFELPKDSLAKVSISAIGYKPEVATLLSGKVAGISLKKNEETLNEVVVVGFGSQKKQAVTGSSTNLKTVPAETVQYPHPEGGWENFYTVINKELGVDKNKADKLLHIRFTIKNGQPENFTIIKTPNNHIADEAILAIKNGPRWKSLSKSESAEIKIKVE